MDFKIKQKLSTEDLRKESFESGYSIQKYFEMLPGDSEVKSLYYEMRNSEGKRKSELQDMLRASITSGAFDVNIMTKLDKTNYTKEGED